jgi:hypothetical protein
MPARDKRAGFEKRQCIADLLTQVGTPDTTRRRDGSQGKNLLPIRGHHEPHDGVWLAPLALLLVLLSEFN